MFHSTGHSIDWHSYSDDDDDNDDGWLGFDWKIANASWQPSGKCSILYAWP